MIIVLFLQIDSGSFLSNCRLKSKCALDKTRQQVSVQVRKSQSSEGSHTLLYISMLPTKFRYMGGQLIQSSLFRFDILLRLNIDRHIDAS